MVKSSCVPGGGVSSDGFVFWLEGFKLFLGQPGVFADCLNGQTVLKHLKSHCFPALLLALLLASLLSSSNVDCISGIILSPSLMILL